MTAIRLWRDHDIGYALESFETPGLSKTVMHSFRLLRFSATDEWWTIGDFWKRDDALRLRRPIVFSSV